MADLLWRISADMLSGQDHHFALQYTYNSSNTFATMSAKYTHTNRRGMSPEASSSASTALQSGKYSPRSSLKQRKRPFNAPTSTLGSTVQPGKVLGKADRLDRIDSQGDAKEEEDSEEELNEWTFAYCRRKISRRFASFQLVERLNASLAENLAPEAAINAAEELRSGARSYNFRRIIVFLISVLIVFGALWTVVTHLLSATRASAQCIPSTVYYPVTTTYTTSIYPSTCASSSPGLAAASTQSSTTTYTTTSTSTSTTTVTVIATATPTATSTLPFLFTGDSTTTVWLSDHSPSSGASLVTATTTISVSAAALSSPSSPSSTSPSSTLSYVYRTSTVQTTLTKTATVTPDALTSTSWSVVSDSTSTIHTTRTSTVTALSTLTRTSFGGSGSLGWNATSPIMPSGTGSAVAVASNGIPTTATVTYYWATSGGQTYSTSTTTLTTTFFGTLPQDTTVTGNATTTTETVSQVTTPATTSSTISTVTSSTLSSSLADAFGRNTTSIEFPTMTPGSYGILPSTGSSGSSAGAGIAPAYGTAAASSGVEVEAAGFSSTSSVLNGTVPSATTTSSSVSSNSSSTLSSATTTSVTYSPAELTSIVRSIMGDTTVVPGNSSTASTVLAPSNGFYSYGYGAPLVTVSPSSMTPLSSATPSTQLLSSFGSSLANGGTPPPPTTTSSSSTSSSTISSTTSTSTSNPSSTLSSSTMTSSSTMVSAIPPTPSVCGEHGNFTLTFDDLPTFSGNDSLDITQAPPIWNPYHHLTFADGYVYAPLPKEPYSPHSGSKLAVFLGNSTGKTLTPSAMSPGSTGGEPGEISNGQYDGNTAFWFDARTAWVGCDNPGPDSCILNVTGYVWDANISDDIGAYKTQYTVPPCPQQQNCQLVPITFPPSFKSLTGLQIQAFVGEQQRMFFLDDLALGWSNNSCAAGLTRQSGGRGFGPGMSGGGIARSRIVRKWIGA